MWEAVVVPPRPENVTCTSIVCASVLMMTVACPVPGEPVGRNFARPEHDGAVSNDTSVCCLPQNESGNHRHVQVFHCLLLFPVPGTKCQVSGRGRWHRLNYRCWEHTMSNRVCQHRYTRCYRFAGCRPTYCRVSWPTSRPTSRPVPGTRNARHR